MDPAPFLRGNPWPPTSRVPYPRADPSDRRLPADTFAAAQVPATVRLEFADEVGAVTIAYRTATGDLGYRGPGAGTTFQLWGGTLVDEARAVLGEGKVDLHGDGWIVYLPEGMRPEILSVEAVVEPAPSRPRWICYGDSIAEGWCASCPAMAWPAIASREHGLDVSNLGYAGAARGEVVSAEQIASLDADVVSVAFGTNCWTAIPHSTDLFRAGFEAFLDVVRQGHPDTPIVVASPIVRPDAEDTPNRLGASLSDLRATMEDVAEHGGLTLVRGRDLVSPSQLADGVHPDDDGHRALAGAIGAAVAEAAR